MDTTLRTYYLSDGDRIVADSAEDFVMKLRTGSFFDSEGTDEAYMLRFVERYGQLRGRRIRTDTKAHFVEDLIATGYIERIV